MNATKAGRRYALKVFSDDYLKRRSQMTCRAVDLFERETAILKSVSHPQIPRYVEAFACEEMYCMVQEYMPGNTLAELINHGDRYDEKKVKVLLHDLLKILSFLHTPGGERPSIVHRDLRLSNLILGGSALFLIDFGLACRLGSEADETLLRQCCQSKKILDASPTYIRMRNDFSLQSDLFGAGVVAVDLFTNSVTTEERLPWEQKIPVSDPFRSWIRQLLGKERMFASCREAVESLRLLQ